MSNTRTFATALVALTASACNGSAFDDPDHAGTWANAASAVGVFAECYVPLAFADGRAPFSDPSCPVTHDDGTTVTIEGGCTASDGFDYHGTVTVVRSGPDARTVTFDDYGTSGSLGDSRLTGTCAVHAAPGGAHAFEVDLVDEGGETTTYQYAGTVAGTYDTPTVWNGTGTVERRGLAAPRGVVEAETVDERLDDAVCSGQATSGQTTLRSGGHVAVITYDGATDCDEAKAARLSVDGEDRGLVEGITCAVRPGAGSPWPLAVMVALGAVLVRRRR